MNERELGQHLLTLDTSGRPDPDPQELTRRILHRDRLRVKALAWSTALLWLLGAGGVLFVIYFFFDYLVPRLRWIAREPERFQHVRAREQWLEIGEFLGYVLGGSFGVLLLAALATVLLVLATRRATLRQINANLSAIAEQLRQLQQGLSPPPS
jgi:hypothetical protein